MTTLSVIMEVSVNFGGWTFLAQIVILVWGVEEFLPFVPNVLATISRKLNPKKQRWTFIPHTRKSVSV